jgi:hypothetical protein
MDVVAPSCNPSYSGWKSGRLQFEANPDKSISTNPSQHKHDGLHLKSQLYGDA